MLVEIAIGDAYGAGFEFCDREKIARANTLAGYVQHELGIAPGCYTDDTQMSVAVAEVLLRCDALSPNTFADAFVHCYQRDPRQGYAKGFQKLLGECFDGTDLRQRIRPTSSRNGAAMRSVPLGVLADRSRLLSVAKKQATVTHDSPEGILSSQVVALMAHALLHERAELDDLPRIVRDWTGFELQRNWSSEVECDAMQTLHAVNTALLRNERMSCLLRDCVDFGGDVDSVASIALGLASLTSEYEKDLPAFLWDELENGLYGKNFLYQLDVNLMRAFKIKNK